MKYIMNEENYAKVSVFRASMSDASINIAVRQLISPAVVPLESFCHEPTHE